MNARWLKLVEQVREEYGNTELYSQNVRTMTLRVNKAEDITLETVGEGTTKEDRIYVDMNVSEIASKLTIPQFVRLLDDWNNWISVNETRRGLAAGMIATRCHRTMQRTIIGLLFGMIYGLSLGGTDARNETAVKSCKQVADLMDDEQLPIGPFI